MKTLMDIAELIEPKELVTGLKAYSDLMNAYSELGDESTRHHHENELLFLYELAYGAWNGKYQDDGHIVQFGVHYGASLCMLGRARQDYGSIYSVYGIDPYKPQKESDGYIYPHTDAYLGAREGIENMGLSDDTGIIVFDSVKFVVDLGAFCPIQIAFIDSNHTAEHVTNEIYAVESCINPGGWIAFHDVFHTKLPDFSAAIEEWILENKNRFSKILRLRRYPEQGHEHSWVPMSIIACQKEY